MKKKLIIASVVAAITATAAYAAVMCTDCNGTGWKKIPGNNVIKCHACGGDGVLGN